MRLLWDSGRAHVTHRLKAAGRIRTGLVLMWVVRTGPAGLRRHPTQNPLIIRHGMARFLGYVGGISSVVQRGRFGSIRACRG